MTKRLLACFAAILLLASCGGGDFDLSKLSKKDLARLYFEGYEWRWDDNMYIVEAETNDVESLATHMLYAGLKLDLDSAEHMFVRVSDDDPGESFHIVDFKKADNRDYYAVVGCADDYIMCVIPADTASEVYDGLDISEMSKEEMCVEAFFNVLHFRLQPFIYRAVPISYKGKKLLLVGPMSPTSD